MATRVSISSNALQMLGDNSINSLSEDNDRAKLAANLYDQVRDALLRSHSWNCATKMVVLAPTTTLPPIDWDYEFILPADWLKTQQVGAEEDRLDYRTMSGRIYADVNALPLIYTWRNDVEGTWDSMLVEAMTLAMQAHMAYAITKSSSMKDSCTEDLARFLKSARTADGQDDPAQTLGDFPLLQSRF